MEDKLGLSRTPREEHSTYGVPTSLNLGRKIFLSHCGNDKEFVTFLHKELCSRYHDDEVVFFDVKTLPTAEAISMANILIEAGRSELGVLVLTEAFFVQTPNPMLELEEFVASKVKLLPLFFGMSVKEFKEKKRTCRWEEHWKTNFVRELGGRKSVEERIVIWKQALDLVTIFSGLEYEKIATNHLEYIYKIVDKVTSIIPPTISFCEKGIRGKEYLCKIMNNMYEKCVKKSSGFTALDVVGIHGFMGLGKTTLCKCLCDFYFTKFHGKVCYINIGPSVAVQASSQKSSFSNRMQYVLSRLGMCTSNDFFNSLDINQVKSWFKKKISSLKDPIFLAIDNILPEPPFQEEAEFYLSCNFSKGSKIFITSRSESILTNLVSQYNHSVSFVINYMPALEFKAAKEIFMSELPSLSEFEISKLEGDIEKCVNMCTIHRIHYYPLMLQSLAAYIKWNRSSKTRDWKGRLTKLCSEGITDKDDPWEKLYNMFDKIYALLTKEAQRVLLDLVLFYNATKSCYKIYEWMDKLYSHLRKEKMDKIILQLKDFRFIEKEEHCTFLDLMVNYGKYKASQGELESEYLVMEDGAPGLDDSRRTARTVSISRCGHHMVDLRGVEGVKVLHIVDNAGLQEVLLSTTSHLRSLIVRAPAGTPLIIHTMDEDRPSRASVYSALCVGRGLQWVSLEGDVYFRSLQLSLVRRSLSNDVPFNSLREVEIASLRSVATDLVSVLGGLPNLEHLNLSNLPGVRSIDVTTCSNLKVLHLSSMPRLQFINVDFKNPKLEDVSVQFCHELLELSGFSIHSKAALTIAFVNDPKRVSIRLSSSPGALFYFCIGTGNFFARTCLSPRKNILEPLTERRGFCGTRVLSAINANPSRQEEYIIHGHTGLHFYNVGFGFSIFGPRIAALDFPEYNSESALRLPCGREIALQDAGDAGRLTSVFFKAQPENPNR